MKAILVLDEMPESCMECPFAYEYEQMYFCKTLKKITGAKDECPLKPMPEKKEIIKWDKQKYPRYIDWCEHLKDLSTSDWEESFKNDGYNKCIKDILGETE